MLGIFLSISWDDIRGFRYMSHSGIALLVSSAFSERAFIVFRLSEVRGVLLLFYYVIVELLTVVELGRAARNLRIYC